MRMNSGINKFVSGLIILSVSLFACTDQPKDNKSLKPNILWIIADDLGTDMGCYGTPLVKTPNLDKLAGQGTKYTNLFTVTAVCSPSRSSLITGMYPVSIDCHQHRTHDKKPLPDGVIPVTEYFREAGYFVSNGSVTNRDKPGKQDYNFLAENIYDGTDWTQRNPGQPFFSQIQIYGPHREFQRDQENPVNADSIILPPYYPDNPLARQDWAHYLENIQIVDSQVGEILKRLEEDGLLDSTVVFFFGDQGRPHVRAKQFMYDSGIHTPLIIRLPREIRSQRNDEVIISWGWPGYITPGSVDNRLISNVDLSVTALKIAGIDPPDYIQGKDFLSPGAEKREAIFAMRDRRDETVDRIRCVRTEKYKYIRNFYPERPYTQFNAYKKHQYPVLTLMQVLYKQGKLTPVQAKFMGSDRPAEELYDLEKDPYEINNLVNDPGHKDILAGLRSKLNTWLEEADRGTYPEDPEEITYWESFMKKNFEIRMKQRGLATDISDEEFLKYWVEYLKPTQKE